jgi:3'-phosphoadenosine 5'-phosphosulfate sulfotransferase (PAPS reductase)/FAD synthetase
MVLFDALKNEADGIVHINTGIGVPETNDFVRKVVAGAGRALIEMEPPIPYDDLVLGRWKGFPGPGGHLFAYTMLKERCIEQLLRDHRTKRGQRFFLLTGVRNVESQRRMGRGEDHRRRKGQVWVNPINNWSNELMAEYRQARDLPMNEVTKHLHMSGECLCGAFAKPGELNEIAFFYPHVAQRIRNLEVRAKNQGIVACKWGERRKKGALPPGPGPMCNNCVAWQDGDAKAEII